MTFTDTPELDYLGEALVFAPQKLWNDNPPPVDLDDLAKTDLTQTMVIFPEEVVGR